MKKREMTGLIMAILGVISQGLANNLQITNVTLLRDQYPLAKVRFDIRWENSWRHATTNDPLYFHDAAWVFFNVQRWDGQPLWAPLFLEGSGTNPPGYSAGSGTSVELVVPSDQMGLFIRRAEEGEGTTEVQGVQVVVNLASSGVFKTDRARVQAFGVEMVYVAEGPFWAGDNGSGGNQFTLTQITTHVANVEGGYPTGQTAPNANWPNGYRAFYCMKYEITEGQWVDFFNSLTNPQKVNRDITASKGGNVINNRNTVMVTNQVAYTLRPDRACNWVSAYDVLALADWARLRPMTELEFEKACRGPLYPIPYEYAWGTTTIRTGAIQLSGTEDGTERIISDVSAGGCHYGVAITGGDGGWGPLRVGIFATNGATRITAGAGYWGIMELSGNVYERAVTIGTSNGRAYTGLHGDGILTTQGEANQPNWHTSSGLCFRGGGCVFIGFQNRLQVSNRDAATYTGTEHSPDYGARFVRTAP